MKASLSIFSIALVLVLQISCEEASKKQDIIKTPMGVVLDNPAGHTPEFIKEIEKPIAANLAAIDDGDPEKIADSFFEIVWLENKREDFVTYGKQYQEMGFEQTVDTFELRYLSEVVDTLGMQFVSLRFYMEVTMWFNEKFVGDPASYETNLKSLYGAENVTYNPNLKQFKYKGERVAHAAKYSEDKEWKYIEDEYNIRVSHAIIPTDMYLKIRALVKYE